MFDTNANVTFCTMQANYSQYYAAFTAPHTSYRVNSKPRNPLKAQITVKT